jgi:uncharacterized membrane protein
MVLNLILVAVFVFNLGIRYNATPESDRLGLTLSIIGIVILSVSGWLGGALVFEHRVGVAPPRDDRTTERRAA